MAIMVADAIDNRLVLCGAKLAAIGIRYEDQEEDVAHRQLVVVITRFTICPLIVDHMKQAVADVELPKQWLA